jgi:uncharacterized protein YdeI (YjbR/CyaY-like superfamily)
MSAADYPRVHVKTAAEWRRWLRDHHATERGAWLVSYRRVTGKPAVEYDDAVRDALCYGWIDSVVKPLDDERTISLYTPRKSGSGWSRSNKERLKELIAEDRMSAAGLAKVEAAKKDGSWTLLDSVEALVVPPDLKKALGAAGLKRFDALTKGKKREHLYALVSAKRPETRARRVADVVRSLKP